MNDTLRAAMVEVCTGADLPDAYRIQMEHQCMVCPTIERTLFMASKWADDGTLIEERHCWYYPDLDLRRRIVAGWKQFEEDVAAYVPEPPKSAPVFGRAPETLPALHVVLKGEVSASNLEEFKAIALAAIRSVNRDLKTDQDFADSAKARKWCEDIESRVAAAKEHALSQTASIDLLFRTMDEVSAEAREVRLALEKLEKARKESRKEEIVFGGAKALGDHIAELNVRLGGLCPPACASARPTTRPLSAPPCSSPSNGC
jgi:predicted phage-related endonuclease